ncbi:MAG TPA: NifB/NifX family molybdenum-iron cluster-binding protein [Candidatus Paceibacterota bacterium]|nr:NifB/NifX family molybdenum-iron cluster-binding protein [Verrucomicrobiota bacterium]HRY50170.1 NifB/NifX family molybdenum-iron cluster-binding protein [Candidatus Paceibacterota bacterium]
MKFAVTAQGPEVESSVDPRFGRARYFRVVDSETGQQTVVDNATTASALQGAGIQAAKTLANLGVSAVLTGHVGPKAWSALEAAKIEVYAASGISVDQAIKAFAAKQLTLMTASNAQAHW